MTNLQKTKQFFSVQRILIPILIGFGVSGYLLYQNLQKELFIEVASGRGEYIWQDKNQNQLAEKEEFIRHDHGDYTIKNIKSLLMEVSWSWWSSFCLLLAFVSMAIRDLAYMLRLRILSDNFLSWRQCFDSVMLWETASAITPSVVGGSGVAIFILNREGINLGKSSAIVLVTALLDELFFILIVPLCFVFLGRNVLFPVHLNVAFLGYNLHLFTVFIIGYAFIVVLTTTILWGVFFRAAKLKRILFYVFSLKVLRKFRPNVIVMGNDIILASKTFKQKKISFWLKSFLSTCASWLARYFTANFIIMAFVSVDSHLLILGRQLVMWVVLLISPTPGGSGVAEVLFVNFLKDTSIHQFALIAAIIWRMISYYPYLFIGTLIFPNWLKKTAKN